MRSPNTSSVAASMLPAVAYLKSLLEHRRWTAGETIIRRGDAANAIYLLTAGTVSVTIDNPSGRRRLSTLSAGMTFGELAVIDRTERSADVHVDRAAEGYVLSIDTFRKLGTARPDVKLVLLENLLRNAAQTAARLSREVEALAR